MNNKILLLLLTLFISISLLFYVLNKQTKIEYDRIQKEKLELKLAFIKLNKEINEQLADISIQNIIIEDSLSKQHFLSDLINWKPVLIYRYSELNCNTCYETEIDLLHKLFAENKQRMIILCSYKMKQYFLMFKRMNKILLPIYRIPQNSFSWEMEDYGSPYYFVLHPDMKISHIFVTDKEYPELNKQYLESVKRLLQDEN